MAIIRPLKIVCGLGNCNDLSCFGNGVYFYRGSHGVGTHDNGRGALWLGVVEIGVCKGQPC